MLARRSLLLGAGGAAALAALPAAEAVATTGAGPLPLPRPTGGHPVGTLSFPVVDHTRTDPFAGRPGPRELMTQLWFPLTGDDRDRGAAAPYTEPPTATVLERSWGAPPGSLARIRTGVRTARRAPRRPTLVMISHGRGATRALTTALAAELASHGHLVAAVDHTHDAAAVHFPDGRLVLGNLPAEPADWDAQDRLETAVRAADLRTVADELTARRLAPARIGLLGHSMGGAAAAEAMRQDRRFAAGLDLDGGLFGTTVPDTGLDRPFLLLTSSPEHETWVRWRAAHRGWGRHLHLLGGGHLSATDLAGYAGPLGLRGSWPDPVWRELFGTLHPDRATAAIRACAVAFFGRFLAGRPAPLLRGPSARFPEVAFHWSRGR
ncbi:alpha/beta hydrolase [Streptomyces yaizuensis]|uniref:Alpha/beta hydrolase n=1 Tax=Streptomyces yaizuensis TaxID=2989713 RepID=A0ABQ5NSL6_9ACTN|nr:alpha/beta hydrolase [Streptomyces sp. YSPA8]GLF93345.1 alpha/beta hydrolase [Streptomyces sp. YSPA8]